MATFFMFGKYTSESIREISIERTDQVVKEIKKLKGKVNAMHALLGEYDLLFCVDLPNIEAAVQVSLKLVRLTGISFTTFPAMPIKAFDELAAKK